MAADAEELGACVVLAAERGEPLWTAAEDGGGDSNCLNVGDGGGAAVETYACWEWGLEAGLALLAWRQR